MSFSFSCDTHSLDFLSTDSSLCLYILVCDLIWTDFLFISICLSCLYCSLTSCVIYTHSLCVIYTHNTHTDSFLSVLCFKLLSASVTPLLCHRYTHLLVILILTHLHSYRLLFLSVCSSLACDSPLVHLHTLFCLYYPLPLCTCIHSDHSVHLFVFSSLYLHTYRSFRSSVCFLLSVLLLLHFHRLSILCSTLSLVSLSVSSSVFTL